MAKPLQVGDPAPDFSLKNAAGKKMGLKDFTDKQPIVLYFYPKDDSPGCTAQACGFRDHYEDFKDLGAEVIGISSDSEASHQAFTKKHQLPFILLADPGGKTRKLFGVPSTLGLLPGRVTYVIDKTGIIRYIFNSQLQAKKHVDEALTILKDLN